MSLAYPLVSVIIVSLISVIFAIPFLLKKKISNKTLLFLLSFSVGVLLSTVFMGFLPEAILHSQEHADTHGHYNGRTDPHDLAHSNGHSNDQILIVAFYVLAGFLIMFALEKFVHYHHAKKVEHSDHVHGHAYHLAPVNLIGDGVHNFIDGLVIAGSYAVNVTLGIAATISIIFHEIPQEIADFGILLYSGMSKKRALIFNFLSATTAIAGTVIGLFLVGRMHNFTDFIIPFAAGNFVYIAASNLVPQLHRECRMKDTLIHFLAIILGIVLITLLKLYGPAHVH